MKVITEKIHIETEGQGNLIDITPQVGQCIEASRLNEGSVLIFVIGSTASISTIEYEPGLIKDMSEVYEAIAPRHRNWQHHETWGDDNGSSHVRATMQGCSITVPFKNKKMFLGTWQQIILMEFDTRPRQREVVAQITGV